MPSFSFCSNNFTKSRFYSWAIIFFFCFSRCCSPVLVILFLFLLFISPSLSLHHNFYSLRQPSLKHIRIEYYIHKKEAISKENCQDDGNIFNLEPMPKIDKHLAWKSAVYRCGGLQDSQTSSDYQKNPWWLYGMEIGLIIPPEKWNKAIGRPLV